MMRAMKQLGMTAAIIGAMSAAPVLAQEIPADASNFYKSESVTVRQVTFPNQYNMNIAGNLFLPKNLDQKTKHAAIIVGHPMGAVKEQSANLYAVKMAEQGIRHPFRGSGVLGRKRRPAAQCRFTGPVCRNLQRRRGLPRHEPSCGP